MKRNSKTKVTSTRIVSSVAAVIIIAIIVVLTIVSFSAMNNYSVDAFCLENKDYFSDLKECSRMTSSEKIDTICIADMNYTYTFKFKNNVEKTVGCKEIKEKNYEKIVTDKNKSLVMYGDTIYIEFSKEEITKGKETGRYCSNNSEIFDWIGKNRCIYVNVKSTSCSEEFCSFVSTMDNKTIYIVFDEYSKSMIDIFNGRYMEGHYYSIYGNIEKYDNGIQIKVSSEKDQIGNVGYYPWGGDGTFVLREFDGWK